MVKIVKIFLWGLMISFLGSLPLGTLNIAAMQIGIYEGVENALYFSLGSLLVEMLYVRISLIGINWLQKQKRLMKIMQWVTFGIVVLLAFGSFYAAIKTSSGGQTVNANPYENKNISRFLLGAFGCAINPIVIIFWFGWSTVLFTKKILEPVNSHFNSYIVGIGLGALAGNCVFIFGGKWLVERISNSQQYLNWVIGAIFTLTALIQLVKNLRNKPIKQNINEAIEKDLDLISEKQDI